MEAVIADGPADETLQHQLDGLRSEVDAIQNNLLRSRTPWYRNPSVIISTVALLFSFGTTYVSYQRTEQQDIHDARTELRTLILRLSALPRERVELGQKYGTNAYVIADLSAALNAEGALIAKQAADVTDRIPTHVSATEYYAVGYALFTAGLVDRSLKVLSRAVATSSDQNEELGALRQYAVALFAAGNLEAGREYYGRALAVFQKYPSKDPVYINQTHAFTEMYWAQVEAGQRQCTQAASHLQEARKYAAALPSEVASARLPGLAEVQKYVEACRQ